MRVTIPYTEILTVPFLEVSSLSAWKTNHGTLSPFGDGTEH